MLKKSSHSCKSFSYIFLHHQKIKARYQKLMKNSAWYLNNKRIRQPNFFLLPLTGVTVLSCSKSHTLLRVHASNRPRSPQPRRDCRLEAARLFSATPPAPTGIREGPRGERNSSKKDLGSEGLPGWGIQEGWDDHGYTARFREILGAPASPYTCPSLLEGHPG